MTSLREDFLSAQTAQLPDPAAVGHFVDQKLSDTAAGLESQIRDYIRTEAKSRDPLNKGSVFFLPTRHQGDRVMIACQPAGGVPSLDPAYPTISYPAISVADIKNSDSYKKIHAICADPKVDMAVRVITRADLDEDLRMMNDQKAAIVIVVLNKPYSDSPEAGIHLKKTSPRPLSNTP